MNTTTKTTLIGTFLGIALGITISSMVSGSKTEAISEKETTAAIIAPPVNKPLNLKKSKIKIIKAKSEQVLYFNTQVDKTSVDAAITALESMSKEYDTIYLMINSPGGSVFDGVRLTSYIEASKKNINTVCVTLCASMAAHLFETGKTRMMLDGGVLMFHPAAGGADGQVENMLSMLNMVKQYVDKLDARTVSRSNLNYEVFKSKVATEYWVTSEEAINTKLADEVVMLTTDDPDKPYGRNLLDGTAIDLSKKPSPVKSLTKLPNIYL